MKRLILVLLLLPLAACQKSEPVKFADVLVSYNGKIGDHKVSLYSGPQKFDNGVTVQVYEDGVVRVMIDRPVVTQADQATAAKVAAVMQANDITLGDVAEYLDRYGYDVIGRDQWHTWHWRPSSGTVDYYVAEIRMAVADTILPLQFRGGTTTPYRVRVQGYDWTGPGQYTLGEVSDLGWSDGNDGSAALPGVADRP